MRRLAKKQKFKLIDGGKTANQKKKNTQNKSRNLSGAKSDKKKAGHKGKGIALVILLLFICALLGAVLFVQSRYHVENVVVEGNVHYSKEEIVMMVLEDKLDYNSLYLSFKYRNKEIKDIPFIQTMSVEVLSTDTIKITVYEKSVAGYVEYMGRFIYFDRTAWWWSLRKQEPPVFLR